jgi:hypothetical protein
MNRQFETLLIAVTAGALLAVAGTVFADVPDDAYMITDNNEPESMGLVHVYDASSGVDIYATCEAFAEVGSSPAGSRVEFQSWHPDGVKLKNEKAQVGQTQKGNPSFVRFVTGSGEDQEVNWLGCEKSEIDGGVKTKDSISGSLSASAKNCSCDETGPGANCEVFADQLAKLAADCDGLKSISGSFEGASIKNIKAKVKGDGEVYDD